MRTAKRVQLPAAADDLERAIRAQQAAEKRLQEMQEDDAQYEIAEAKLKRALIRQQVKG